MRDEGREQHVKELTGYLREHFSKQKTMIRKMRDLRALMHEVQIPKAYQKSAKVVRTPLLADMIQRITATLSVNYPTWTRGTLGEAERDKSNSTAIKAWLKAAHMRMESQARRRVFRMLMDSAIADGMAVSQILWHPETYAPWPKRKPEEMPLDDPDSDLDKARERIQSYDKRVQRFVRERPFPFEWKDVDPLNYYYWDAYNGKREIVLIETVPLAPTASALGVKWDGGAWEVRGTPGQPLPSESSVQGESAELVQHWTDNDVAYTLDGKLAKVWKHGWGRRCIFDFSGMSTHERSPERAFLPVTFAFAELVPFLDALLTMKSNWMYLSAFPRAVLKLSADRMREMQQLLPDNRKTGRASDVSENLSELDSLLLLYENEQFDFVKPPPVGDDLNQLIQLTMGLIDSAGMGNLLKGNVPAGVDSGYLYNQATVAGRLAYDPITDNAKFMFNDQAEFLLWAIDNLAKAPVPVWGETGDKDAQGFLELGGKLSGGKDNLDGIYMVECQLEPLLPSNLIMEGRFGLEQVGGGALSMYTHREKFLRLDPQEEEKRIAIERVKNSPRVVAAYDYKVAKEAGILPEEPPSGLVDQNGNPFAPSNGQAVNLGNLGMPATPGQGGMPVDPGAIQRQGMPISPSPDILPGVGPTQNPGGSFGRR